MCNFGGIGFTVLVPVGAHASRRGNELPGDPVDITARATVDSQLLTGTAIKSSSPGPVERSYQCLEIRDISRFEVSASVRLIPGTFATEENGT